MANNKYAKTLVKVSKQINKQRETELLKSATLLFLSATAMALRDSEGFGGTRLTRVLNGIHSNIEQVGNDYCTVDDMINAVKDETGIDIREITGE